MPASVRLFSFVPLKKQINLLNYSMTFQITCREDYLPLRRHLPFEGLYNTFNKGTVFLVPKVSLTENSTVSTCSYLTAVYINGKCQTSQQAVQDQQTYNYQNNGKAPNSIPRYQSLKADQLK